MDTIRGVLLSLQLLFYPVVVVAFVVLVLVTPALPGMICIPRTGVLQEASVSSLETWRRSG